MTQRSIARRLARVARLRAQSRRRAWTSPSTNNNNPDRIRATNTPGDVESLIAGTFQRWWPNVYSTTPTVMFGVDGL